jgi:hypothetical protein
MFLLALLVYPIHSQGQTLQIVSQTEAFTDYVLTNDSLNIGYRQELIVPHRPGNPSWRVLEQEIVRQRVAEVPNGSANLNFILADVDPTWPVIHEINPGVYRKQNVASLLLHVVRRTNDNPDELLITRQLRVRVYTEPQWNTEEQILAREITSDQSSPLSGGTWYKIPITRDGIHIIDRQYLQALGINVDQIDPRNIQLWGTSGFEMPRLNSVPRPEFQQIPIIVNGETDGRFDASDAVIFYGNSQNRTWFDTQTQSFEHSVHPYSSTNYVFITVGEVAGLRLQTVNSSNNPSRTVTQIRDVTWKEEDLMRTDNRTKSGIRWFGQQFTTESFARTQSILADTLTGFVQGSSIRITAEFVARGTRNSRFEVMLGSVNVGAVQIAGIPDPNRSSGMAANISRLRQNVNNVNLSNAIFNLESTFSSLTNDAVGWLDWVRIEYDRELRARNGVLLFWSPTNGALSEIAEYQLAGFSNQPLVMDVSNPVSPVLLSVSDAGSAFTVRHHTRPGTRFVAQTQFFRPAAGSQVANQNLRGLTDYPDYIIVTSDELLPAALEFAEYRRINGGWRPVVATQSQIFNEFSGGVPDIAAIRDYVRYIYLRAGTVADRIPQHLLLFGNTTSDFRGIDQGARMINHVFTFQSLESLNRSNTYASDDFFVLLDNNEGLWDPTGAPVATFERIDMGIGRLPVQSLNEARQLMQKIELYENPATFGDWRTIFTFSSDDHRNGAADDGDLHVWNADGTAERINRDQAGVRVNKVYQASFPVINTPSGRRTPEGTQAFINSINNGTLVMNFSGHGSEQLLTAERLFSSDDIPRLENRGKPTIFVTATCDFGRFDDTDDYSGAEKLINWNNGGAIAAFTTTRVVFTSSFESSYNFGLNIQLTQDMVRRDNEGRPLLLGEIYRRTKNTTIGATFNSRKFVLLGDPAMRIGLPQNQASISAINNQPINTNGTPVTLRALDQASVSGEIRNPDGTVDVNFTGEADIQVYDADRFVRITRIAFCSNLPGCQYRVQNDVIFSGRVSVNQGVFNSQFIIPNDIAYSDAPGRILIYGGSANDDAVGSFSNIVFNGRNPNAVNDGTGPAIQIYLNDENFADGGLVNDSPRLIVQLEDQSGINTAGAGVGHELVAYLTRVPDDGREQTIILNSFYRSELDDFRRGRVEYPMDRLPNGRYTLRVRAWDVFNNMNEDEIQFQVAETNDLELRNVYNYPNPLNNYTRFVFEHNQPGRELNIMIRVFTLSGKPVARIHRENYITSGNIAQISWDGRDDDGNYLAAGTYLYQVQVRGEFGGNIRNRERIERLVIIR